MAKAKPTRPSVKAKKTHTKLFRQQKKPLVSQKKAMKDKSLKDMDPEFYKFLQKEDKELLNFDEEGDMSVEDSDSGSEEYFEDPSQKKKEKEISAAKKAFEKEILDMSSGSDESDESEGEDTFKGDTSLEVASDDEDYEYEGKTVEDESDESEGDGDRGKSSKSATKLITVAMVKEWRKQLQDPVPTVETLKLVVDAASAAAQQAGVAEANSLYRVEGTTMFNSVISMCLGGFVPALEKILKVPSLTNQNHVISQKNKKWKSVKSTVKNYCSLMLQLSGELSEGSASILRHLHKFVVCIAGLPGLARVYVKKLVSLWSKGDNTQRVLAFLSISKMLRLQPELLEATLKDMHLNYVRNCSFVNPESLSMISFMQHSLVEVFLLNEELAYQQVFLYVRQMAIHLRNAIRDKKLKNIKAVYNWQYVLSLGLWTQLLSTSSPSTKLQPLIFPLTQVIIGTIRLLPTARYYPLRFHCIRYLTLLSGTTGTFIPVLPFLLEVFEQVDFNKRPKTSNMKQLNMTTILKLTKMQQGDKAFKTGLLDLVCELLYDYLHSQSHLVAFPELIVPMVVQLKDFLKKCKVAVLCKQVKEVLEKAEETAKVIEARRRGVSFNLTDAKAVDLWESKNKEEGTPLSKFYANWRKQKDRQIQQDLAGKSELTKAERLVQNISLPKGPLRATSKEREQFADLFADSDSDDDVLRFLPKSKKGDKQMISKDNESDTSAGEEDDNHQNESHEDEDQGNDDEDDDDDEVSSDDGAEDQSDSETNTAPPLKRRKTGNVFTGGKGSGKPAVTVAAHSKRQKLRLDHDEGDMVDDFNLDDF